jgi:hypothetical protein
MEDRRVRHVPTELLADTPYIFSSSGFRSPGLNCVTAYYYYYYYYYYCTCVRVVILCVFAVLSVLMFYCRCRTAG